MHYGRRWFLRAYDPDRDDWRTLRVDRVRPRIPPGARFTPRELATLPPIAVVEPLDPGHCTLLPAAATAHLLAIYLLGLDTDFDVTGPPPPIDALNAIAHRAQR